MIEVGFDVGGTKTRGNYFCANDQLVASISNDIFPGIEYKTNSFRHPKDFNEFIYHSLLKLGKKNEIVASFSFAGVVDPESSETECANIPFDISVVRYLKKRGIKSKGFNDLFAEGTANARLGVGKEYVVVATQNIGTGNNLACARNGIVFTFGAEAGHSAYNDSGISCGCGGMGHLETDASGSGAAMMAKTHFLAHPNDRRHLILEAALSDWNLENDQKYGMNKLKDDDFFRKLVFYIQGKHVMQAYVKDKEIAKTEDREIGNPQNGIRRLQRNGIAYQLGEITSMFKPDLIVVRGSFVTENWQELGRPAVDRFLNDYSRFVHPKIQKPKVIKKKVKRDGVLGSILCSRDIGHNNL